MSPRPLTAEPLRGDEAALYADFAPTLRGILMRDVRAPLDVIEDACATAWELFLRRQPDRATARGWLIATAKHEAWRLAARNRRAVAPVPLREFDTAAIAEARVRLSEVAAALAPRQRTLVGLQAAGHSHAEMAARTGDTARTVDRQLRRARARLRAAV